MKLKIKIARSRNYLNEDKESLVVASSNIESGRGLPLGCRGVVKKLQNVANATKAQYGD